MLEVSPYLFVYGTLMRAHRNTWSRLLWSSSDCLGPATTPGRLFSLGSYPGLLDPTAPGQVVHGEVAHLHNPAALLAQLDNYEGPSYRRVQRPVLLATGRTLRSWLYLYLDPVRSEDHIPSGKFSSLP